MLFKPLATAFLAFVASSAAWRHGKHGHGYGNGNGNGNNGGGSCGGGPGYGPPGYEPPTDVLSGNSTFQQLIDHDNPSLGTFSQFYYYNDTFWKPNGPVILFTPGEIAALGYNSYLTPRRILSAFAEAIGGAIIVLEHRYWGFSSPFADLTTENMQYLTLKNSIADLVNFARTANLPFDPHHTSNAMRAPWVLSGGSYSGALTGWTASTSPGTFWAYTATSAVVQAQADFWQYFAPVQEGMPKNCSKDLSLVIDYIDNVLTTGTAEEQYELKASFGLGGLVHNDDFGSALENGPWLWQGNQFYRNSGFFTFCDYIENANYTNATIPGAKGVGLQKALAGYAYWFNSTVLPGYCAGYGYWTDTWDISCFDTYNASSPFYTDISVDNAIDRQWEWFLCNEPFGYWQNGAPAGRPSIVSRLVTSEYWQRQCALFFPTQNGHTFGSNLGVTEEDVNNFTKGWDFTNSTRLFWVNGQYDPWKDVTVSSDFRPGGPLKSTKQVPVKVIPGGYHCSDLITMNGVVNAGVLKVQNAQIKQVKKWVKEFYTSGGWGNPPHYGS